MDGPDPAPDQLSPSALCGHVGFVATSTIWTALGTMRAGARVLEDLGRLKNVWTF